MNDCSVCHGQNIVEKPWPESGMRACPNCQSPAEAKEPQDFAECPHCHGTGHDMGAIAEVTKLKAEVKALQTEVEAAKNARNRAGVEERRKYIPLIADTNQVLSQLQESVWTSLRGYSNALGWGLTGIQPECWIMLDMAVEELRKRRQNDAQVIRILDALHPACLNGEMGLARDDSATLDHILKTKTLV